MRMDANTTGKPDLSIIQALQIADKIKDGKPAERITEALVTLAEAYRDETLGRFARRRSGRA